MIPITTDQDGDIPNRGYAYWPQAYLRDGAAYVFCGNQDGYPRFYKVGLQSGQVERLGTWVDYPGTGEGWYWLPDGTLMVPQGPRLHRIDPFNRSDDVVMDVGRQWPGYTIWQPHSSDDGRVHSATLQNAGWQKVGTVVSVGGDLVPYWPTVGELDESHLDTLGDWCAIEEGNHLRIISLRNNDETVLYNKDPSGQGANALSHIDCGPGYMVGEDDQAGGCYRVGMTNPVWDRVLLFPTWGMGHVSVKAGRCLLAGAERLSLVALDGSGLTPLHDHGMVVPPGMAADDPRRYDYQVHANLDHTASVVVYASNRDGQMRLFLYTI